MLDPPVPGLPSHTNVFAVSGATPGATVVLFAGETSGGSVVGDLCAVEIADAASRTGARVGEDGRVDLEVDISAESANVTELLQAIELQGCRRSEVVPVTWTIPEWIGVWDPEVGEGKWRGWQEDGVFGSRVTVDGDGDGDGKADLAIAAPHEGEAEDAGRGSVYVFLDPRPGEWVAGVDEDLHLLGEAAKDWAGFGLAWVGDVDADGDSDLVVGAPQNDTNGDFAGAAYLVHMPRTGVVSLSEADAILLGPDDDGYAGMDVYPAGDVDADGRADFWIPSATAGLERGLIFLVSGTVTGTSNLDDASIAMVHGEADGDRAGSGLVTLGDLDGDAVPDIAVGAPSNDRNGDEAGAVFLLPAPVSGTACLEDAPIVIVGDATSDQTGATLALLGDLDGDGAVELGVQTRNDSEGAPIAGSVSVVPIPAGPTISIGKAASLELLGDETGGFAGAHTVTCDVDGDGVPDLLTTAHEAGLPGPESGRAYLFYGQLPTGVVSLGTAPMIFAGAETMSNFGQDVSCADLDADGFDDLVIGAEGDENAVGGWLAGSVYLFEGRARVGGSTP